MARKAREIIRIIESDGWELVRLRGSHRHYKHPSKKGLVTVPGHGNKELKPAVWNSILKQAGLK
jgi:predicted RNA binding protein YcfA (HicA-like mRNA interferase family)